MATARVWVAVGTVLKRRTNTDKTPGTAPGGTNPIVDTVQDTV